MEESNKLCSFYKLYMSELNKGIKLNKLNLYNNVNYLSITEEDAHKILKGELSQDKINKIEVIDRSTRKVIDIGDEGIIDSEYLIDKVKPIQVYNKEGNIDGQLIERNSQRYIVDKYSNVTKLIIDEKPEMKSLNLLTEKRIKVSIIEVKIASIIKDLRQFTPQLFELVDSLENTQIEFSFEGLSNQNIISLEERRVKEERIKISMRDKLIPTDIGIKKEQRLIGEYNLAVNWLSNTLMHLSLREMSLGDKLKGISIPLSVIALLIKNRYYSRVLDNLLKIQNINIIIDIKISKELLYCIASLHVDVNSLLIQSPINNEGLWLLVASFRRINNLYVNQNNSIYDLEINYNNKIYFSKGYSDKTIHNILNGNFITKLHENDVLEIKNIDENSDDWFNLQLHLNKNIYLISENLHKNILYLKRVFQNVNIFLVDSYSTIRYLITIEHSDN